MDRDQRYNYDSYMREGSSWERSAGNCESQRDYLTAKSRYMDAMFAYEKAYDIANRAGDSAANEAYSKISYCKSQITAMAYKYDDAVREYLST